MTVSKTVSRNISRDVSHVITGGDLLSQVVSLFSTRNGLLLDNSPSNFYQDVAGTTPAATGDPVGRWRDASGRGNNATQSTVAAKPLVNQDGNGRYRVYFDGVNDVINALSSTTLTQPNTISIAVRLVDNAVTRPIFSGSGSTRNNLTINTSNQPLIFSGGTVTATSENLSTATTYVLTGIFNGASSVIRVNKVAVATGGAGTESLSQLMIGSNGSAYTKMYVYGQVVVSGLLSTQDLDAVESYLTQISGA